MTSRFEGDGRNMVHPLPRYVRRGTQPVRIRRSMCRWLTTMFDMRGRSNHSGQGAVLWVIIEHCEVNKIPYVVRGRPGFGFAVLRVPQI